MQGLNFENPPFENYAKRVSRGYPYMYDDFQQGEYRSPYSLGGAVSRGASKILAGLSTGVSELVVPNSTMQNRKVEVPKTKFESSKFKNLAKKKDPSAITSRDGIKMSEERIKRLGKKLAQRRINMKKKAARKATKAAINKIKPGFRARAVRGRARKVFPRQKIVSVPFARSTIYRGTRMNMRTVRVGNMNCAILHAKANLGKLQTFNSSGVAIPSLVPNGATELGGQWFMAPTMLAYWPANSMLLAQSRMYQYFYIDDCWFEFEPLYQPGNTTNYNIVYQFVEDPNLGETIQLGYSSVSPLLPDLLLGDPMSGSFPAFATNKTIRPPRRWYAGKKYSLRTYSLLGPIVTNSSQTVAQNKQSIPFGVWFTVDGPPPSATTALVRIFFHYKVKLCDMTLSQTLNNTGSGTLLMSDEKLHKLEMDVNDMKERLSALTVDDKFSDVDLDVKSVQTERIDLKSNYVRPEVVRLTREELDTDVPMRDTPIKSSSVKSSRK